MVTLNAQIIKKEGKKEYAIIPYEEFLKVQEELHNYEDLRCLRKAKEAEINAPTISIDNLKKQIGERTTRPIGSAKKRTSR
ncbi:MAG: type II toxin-antitoxin system Phd/YefM family antitoxin [Proteobacteria bacterium]|nr:type II toxin-antitoxin system Phd/YefM family antitoxin [Pseudomonadota bacterium]